MHLDICLEITYSAIAKYPEIFFDALKVVKMKNPIFLRNWHPRNPCASI